MVNPWLEAFAVFAAIAAVLEVIFFVLKKKLPSFRHTILYHIWVGSLGALAAMYVLGWGPLDTFGAKLTTTLALMLSTLILFAIVDSLIIQRPWNPHADAMVPKLSRDVLRLTLLITVGFFAATKILGQPVGAVLVSSTVLSAVVGLARIQLWIRRSPDRDHHFSRFAVWIASSRREESDFRRRCVIAKIARSPADQDLPALIRRSFDRLRGTGLDSQRLGSDELSRRTQFTHLVPA